MPDAKTQLKTYLDHVVERVEIEDLYVSTARAPESRGSTREKWSTTPRWAAAIATCLLIVVVAALSWIIRSTDQIDPVATVPPTIANPPTPTSPATGPMPTQEDFTWRETLITGELGLNFQAVGPGLDLIVGDGESFVTSDNGETWSSSDGETWTLQPEYVRVIHGAAGQFLGIFQNQTEAVGDDRLAVSDDGVSWEYVTPASEQAPHRFEEFRYEGLVVNEILELHLPEAIRSDHGPDHPGNPSHVGAVLKVDGRYVAYFYDKDTGGLMGAVSEEGRTWNPVQVADFLSRWLDIGNDRAMSDRHLSERLWSSTFASDGTKILALVGDVSGHALYQSSDGITWSSIQPRYLETYPVDPFVSPIDSNSLVWGIAPLSDGWVISSWWEPLNSADPDTFAILFSKDATDWLPLDSPTNEEGSEWRPRVAGDTILIVGDGPTNRLVIGEYDH